MSGTGSSAASSKSAQISALVQQLKQGQITKVELFERLQALQRQTGGPSTAAPAAVAPPPVPAPAPARAFVVSHMRG
jgi:hypothetical protein